MIQLIFVSSLAAFVVSSIVIVANWDTTQVLIKATGDPSQPGILQFAIPLFSHYSNKNMMSRVENILNRSYPRFASTTTTTTAVVHC